MISFIVPAYNEERYLARTLAALHEAARALGEPYEIVVADDASSDGTADLALRHGARLVRVSHRQISATRNAGARQARGDRFVFVDADTVVDHAVVAAAVRALAAGAVGGGSAVRFDGAVPLWARLLLPVLTRLFQNARLAAGCFLFCTRDAFTTVGGFDETLYASEEITMSQALGRHGRFVVLREEVVTSARKLRSYTGREHLRVLVQLIVRGPGMVRRREGLELWYDGRRDGGEDEAASGDSFTSLR